jgi:hypothetical protein
MEISTQALFDRLFLHIPGIRFGTFYLEQCHQKRLFLAVKKSDQ